MAQQGEGDISRGRGVVAGGQQRGEDGSARVPAESHEELKAKILSSVERATSEGEFSVALNAAKLLKKGADISEIKHAITKRKAVLKRAPEKTEPTGPRPAELDVEEPSAPIEKPAPAAEQDGTISGKVASVEVKTSKPDSKRKWKLFKIKMEDGSRVSTFSKVFGAKAVEAQKSGAEIHIETKPGKKGPTIKSIKSADESAEAVIDTVKKPEPEPIVAKKPKPEQQAVVEPEPEPKVTEEPKTTAPVAKEEESVPAKTPKKIGDVTVVDDPSSEPESLSSIPRSNVFKDTGLYVAPQAFFVRPTWIVKSRSAGGLLRKKVNPTQGTRPSAEALAEKVNKHIEKLKSEKGAPVTFSGRKIVTTEGDEIKVRVVFDEKGNAVGVMNSKFMQLAQDISKTTPEPVEWTLVPVEWTLVNDSNAGQGVVLIAKDSDGDFIGVFAGIPNKFEIGKAVLSEFPTKKEAKNGRNDTGNTDRESNSQPTGNVPAEEVRGTEENGEIEAVRGEPSGQHSGQGGEAVARRGGDVGGEVAGNEGADAGGRGTVGRGGGEQGATETTRGVPPGERTELHGRDGNQKEERPAGEEGKAKEKERRSRRGTQPPP